MFFSSNSPKNSLDKATEKVKEQAQQKQPEPHGASSKITERLNKVMEQNSALEKNRSSDLVPLTAEYEQMKHKLRALVSAVKKYELKTEANNDARFELVEHLSKMSEKSPIHDEIGNDVDDETSAALKRLYKRSDPNGKGRLTTTDEVAALKEEYRNREGSDSLSMYGLFSFGKAQEVANGNEFNTHVVKYVVDWEKIVTVRVDTELKKVKELESVLRHYEDKVVGLREKSNAIEEKGKEPSESQAEKLERNEEKLKEAFNKHERQAGKVCALLEAVTHDGYKDLYPMVKNYMKWEMNRISREHDIAERLSETLEALSEKMGSQTNTPKVEEQSYEKGDVPDEKADEPVQSEAQ